jgi:LemA protein
MSSSSLVATVLVGLVCLVLVVLIVWVVSAYNRLVRQRNQVDAAWAQIDVQLKRRYDLIPNLVETVKGYAAHERGTLDAVIQARNTAVATAGQGPQSTQARAQAENALTQSLGRLFALAEAYPNLKANENFLGLQGELSTTEDKIAYARQFYNSAIQTYNTSTQSLPTNLVANVGGFHARTLFEAVDDERSPIQVRF